MRCLGTPSSLLRNKLAALVPAATQALCTWTVRSNSILPKAEAQIKLQETLMPRTVPDIMKGSTRICWQCAEKALKGEVTYSRSQLVRRLSWNSHLGVWDLVVNWTWSTRMILRPAGFWWCVCKSLHVWVCAHLFIYFFKYGNYVLVLDSHISFVRKSVLGVLFLF